MEVLTVWATRDRMEGDQACAELRAHGIKCDLAEPTTPFVATPYVLGGLVSDVALQVVVAPEDAKRASLVLAEWREGRAG